ncbi:MAG TPA: hypothetical protein VF177_04200 [Anaerolineae bacterium]
MNEFMVGDVCLGMMDISLLALWGGIFNFILLEVVTPTVTIAVEVLTADAQD